MKLLTIKKSNGMKKYILLLLLGTIMTSYTQEIKLSVSNIRQKETKWCWAAVSQCVLNYYGYTSIQQCHIAEYTRKVGTLYDYGSTPCCDDASQGCNQENYDCLEPGSVQDILVYFGHIGNDCTYALSYSDIQNNLDQQRPFIIHRKKLDSSSGHSVVGHGIGIDEFGTDVIYYMDPDPHPTNGGFQKMPHDFLLNDGTWEWTHTNVLLVSAIPDHCRNCILDNDKGEEGMDCGGPCPPCQHAPDKVIINTPIEDLPKDVYAINEISAGNAAVKVLSGQNVNFKTLGTIRLLPGFEAQAGSNFNAQIKGSILSVTADCDKFCTPIVSNLYDRWCPLDPGNGNFAINVANVNKIELHIWAPTRIMNDLKEIYSTTVEGQEGLVFLWDLIEEDFEYNLKPDGKLREYGYELYLYPCQGGKFSFIDYFWILNKLHDEDTDKSEFEVSDNSENLPPSFSPPASSITLQDENTTPSFVIIPNPNSGTFQIETNFPLADIDNLKVVNPSGVPVYETQNLVSNEIQLLNAGSGLYFVVATLKDGTALTQKMMLQR